MPLSIELDLSAPENYYDSIGLGEYLKELRTSNDYSYYKLFKESGVHRNTTMKIENGIYVHECYVEKVFDFFGVENPFDLVFTN